MASYWNRVRSFREIQRFCAVDEHGVIHTIVHRIETLHGVGLTGVVVDALQGKSNFYSATTGDAVTLESDGSLTAKHGTIKLKVSLDSILQFALKRGHLP